MARLIQIAQGTRVVQRATADTPEVVEVINTDTALKAVIKGLEVAGLADVEDFKRVEKQAIEIILSAGNGNPLEKRLSGVYRPNNHVEPN